jgi:LysR family glycine cleavage system transcriptional activator
VTPAAVSHQVKSLEAWHGRPLFVRHAQGLHLTDSARIAVQGLSDAFDAMGLAVQELRIVAPRTQVSIAALPSVAQLWLAPKLPGLRAAFSNVQPSVHALETPPNFRREPFDLAIFFIRDVPRLTRSFKICDDVIYPVCTPEVAATLHVPDDLASHPLLWDTAWANDWGCWLSAAGVTGIAANNGPAFSLYSLAVQAALEGAGVLMAHEALTVATMASGALVAPFPIRAATGSSLAILAPERLPARTLQMVDWLIARERRPDSI